MHWQRNSDRQAGTVTFTVLGGYNYRKGLRKQGFDFDGRYRQWQITVPASDDERIDAVERFLKATDKIDQAAARWRT